MNRSKSKPVLFRWYLMGEGVPRDMRVAPESDTEET